MVQKTPTRLLTTTRSDAPVDSLLLRRALDALLKNHEKTVNQGDKSSLLGSDLPVQVQFSLVRVPEKPSSRPICLDIPHPLHRLIKDDADDCDDVQEDVLDDGLDDVEVCLIVKDEAKPWVLDLIQKFPSHLSYIKKVLTLTSLRTKHSQYADKRELVRRYDLFLADDRILPMLGKALGKSFYQQKKQPVPMKVTRKEALPFAVKRCLRGTFMWVSAGTCLSIKAGTTAMPMKNLAENIDAIVKNAASHIPRKWGNIASISMKTTHSVALPIYNKTREDLEEIAALAQINRLEAKDEKKREISHQSEEEIEKQMERKKQKTEMAAKSPMLKALKVLKSNDENEEKKQTKQKKQKKQKKESVPNSPQVKDLIPEQVPKSPLVEALKSIKSKTSEKKKRKKKQPNSTAEEAQLTEAADIRKEPEDKSIQSLKKQKVTDSGAATPKSSKKKDISTPKEKQDFISSRKFKGSKAGYVFYKGSRGIGYYVDVKPVVNFERIVGSNRGGDKSRRSKSPGGKRRKSSGGRNRR